jgi:hypothetical protein
MVGEWPVLNFSAQEENEAKRGVTTSALQLTQHMLLETRNLCREEIIEIEQARSEL